MELLVLSRTSANQELIPDLTAVSVTSRNVTFDQVLSD